MKEKKITREQAEEILGEKVEEILKISEITVYCPNCTPRNDRVVDMDTGEYFLDDLNDIILKGTCQNCGHKVIRRIETGEKQYT